MDPNAVANSRDPTSRPGRAGGPRGSHNVHTFVSNHNSNEAHPSCEDRMYRDTPVEAICAVPGRRSDIRSVGHNTALDRGQCKGHALNVLPQGSRSRPHMTGSPTWISTR